ncbi:MAG: ATP-dependent Clp protease ATP-binding subunit [Clostridia bacterium]|nr:ATP-dependent Clp protease ATP-binding subunit [Clostridia bacterium]
MVCSACKKNMAVIFINKLKSDGKPSGTTEGLCLDCAKARGIDPFSGLMDQMKNISEEDLNNFSSKFSSMIDSMDPEMIEKIEKMPFNLNMFNSQSNSEDDLDVEDNKVFGNVIETQSEEESKKKSKKLPKTKYLDTFGTNLTAKARNNELDKVIGRDKELQRMVQILNRRSKNNPALIGEPGVGKTAIINALAIAIVNGDVPSKLINKELYLIDMTSLVAGTQFRGQFESRIKGIIDECKSLGNVIIAIDEVHNIAGGLEHDNSMNAANMLKPALANGSVQLIGATTLKEYRKSIEKDSALERRFQPIIVDEPTFNDCYEILKGTKKYYEDFHKVTISDEILKKCINLSDKYIHDRFLPDKAIDLLDEACSRVNLDDILLSQIEKIENKLKNVESEIKDLEENMETDTTKGESEITTFERAAKIKEVECKLQTELDGLKKKVKPRIVSEDDLAKVIELWTKIPVAKIKTGETEKLLNLKDNLKKRIIGQDHAIELLSNAILRKRASIKSIEKPPSFIFVGPTGVGKTALVKALAYELFDKEDSIIRMDMSEYMEQHSVSKLIGAPPGYVGYDEAGGLTEKVRRNPYSIILFDEIEKAHQSIYNILLQILDEGILTDSQGRSVSFKHTVIILTSNLGTNFKSDGYGFSNSAIDDNMLDSKVNDSLKDFFSPEFLNRIDDIIIFKKLSYENIISITDLMLKKLQKETKDRNIIFTYSKPVIEFIVNKGYDSKFGARPLNRSIQKYIEDLIAIEYIKGNIKENTEFKLDIEDKAICIK